MAKGKIGEKYFNIGTGAVVKPVYDHDELGGTYVQITENCYPVFDMHHRYVGYLKDNVFIVSWSDDGSAGRSVFKKED